jgi:hypothetical protein
MQKQTFHISINAPRERVWEVLWNKDTYRQWTSAFAEGSTVETDGWAKGSKVLFLDGKGSGMVSVVAENIPDQFMSFKHLGAVKNRVEDTASEKVSSWSGALENYTLSGSGGVTELKIEMDMTPEFVAYFLTTWPKALAKVKQIAEQSNKQ